MSQFKICVKFRAAPAGAVLTTNALTQNALTQNALSTNGLTANAVTSNGISFTGSPLGELNGVAVETVRLPDRR